MYFSSTFNSLEWDILRQPPQCYNNQLAINHCAVFFSHFYFTETYPAIESVQCTKHHSEVWVNCMICCCRTMKSKQFHEMHLTVRQSCNYCKIYKKKQAIYTLICHNLYQIIRLFNFLVFPFPFLTMIRSHYSDLEGNKIFFIHEDSFGVFEQLEDL